VPRQGKSGGTGKEEALKSNQHYPLYTIGVVAEMLGVHPETIRVWETSGAIQSPQRRSGKRFYSENDLKRLRFIRKLAAEGLTQRAMIYYLRLYPCWKTPDCTGCMHGTRDGHSLKPCWQEEDSYCQAASLGNPCQGCSQRTGSPEETVPEPDSVSGSRFPR
jgi:MerR family transcriptional regulator/heat shock protein HspR